ncbi:MAG: 3-isopropylmalate dehydratase small subunit [Eggerthellaceae bacterium]
MQFKGTAHRYGRDIDTDVIIPARYLTRRSGGWRSTAWRIRHVVRRTCSRATSSWPTDPGCGSSREHAPCHHAGVDVVIAKSFAHLYRNSINTGLAIWSAPRVDAISQGDVVSVDAGGRHWTRRRARRTR